MTNEKQTNACRAAFEKYIAVSVLLERQADGYAFDGTHTDWLTYQAAWQAREDEVQRLREALRKIADLQREFVDSKYEPVFDQVCLAGLYDIARQALETTNNLKTKGENNEH